MDTAFKTPWVELVRREDADPDVRLLAAQGVLVPRPAEQLALLAELSLDRDAEVAAAAVATLARVPTARIAGLLARADAPVELQGFFARRGVTPAAVADESEEPLEPRPDDGAEVDEDDVAPAGSPAAEERQLNAMQRISRLARPAKLQLALKGRREERAILIRDPNKVIALAVLSNPRLSDTEVETFAHLTSVCEEVPRAIASTRSWVSNYAICAALVKNPRTPLGIAMNLLPRLTDKDMKSLSTDRNVPDVLRTTARRKVVLTGR
jgi:hypothetical protein